MSSTRRRFTDRTALALPALGAALALVVTSCSASTDSAVSGTVVSKALRELKNKKNWDEWTNVSATYEWLRPLC